MPAALVIPGLVAVDPHRWEGSGRAEVVRGPLAGKAALPELSDWKREIWLLPREAAARRGARLPDAHPGLASHPRLRARLAEAALVLVDDATARQAAAAGEAAIFVAYHRVAGGGGLEVHGPEGVRGFSATDFPLLAQALGEDADEDDDRPTIEAIYDRVLRALTGGSLSLLDVDLADWAARVPASEFASFEAELAEIEATAAPQRPLAESLLAALAAAEADEVPLPGDYSARRRREPAFVLRGDGDVSVIGGPIRVPAGERWFVADVQAFTTPARQARRERMFARHRRGHKLELVKATLLVALALVALVAVCVLGAR